MSATKTKPKPEAHPVVEATISTLAMRVREVGRAWRAEDETLLRAELRQLGAEATFLSAVEPLLPSENGVDRRLRIAAERESLGRIG